MKAFAFGSESEKQAWEIVEKIKNDFTELDFVKSESVADIFEEKNDLLILDVVKGLKKPEFIPVDRIKERNIFTLHDFDLGFFLKLMKEAGKIGNVHIIGVPESFDEKHIKETKKLLKSYLKKVR